ncbi:MAG: BspA family leucine-rich repeat surface protein [Prevotella sp.]|nr:BspA family leucine-rich repeat surface protein [Prevotella sp.]
MNPKTILLRMVVLIATMMSALGVHAAEAYACYSAYNSTLTFYYDNLRSTRTQTTYDLNTGDNSPSWRSDDTYARVYDVVFDSSFAGARPTTTCSWFSDMKNLHSITGMRYLNTSEVTNMKAMFKECVLLTNIYMGSFNTSKVTNMNAMFYNCSNLRTIYVGNGWSTAAVTYSSLMFTNCTSLVGGKGTTWSSSNPTDKTYARIDGGTSNPGYLTNNNNVDAYACYTPENTTLTFYYDIQRGLHEDQGNNTYDLNTGKNRPGWQISAIFNYVTKVVFNPSFANARPTSTYEWFRSMHKLQSIIDLSNLNTSEVTNMNYMFYKCENLKSLDLSHFNTSMVTEMYGMFSECSSLTILDLSGFNTAKVTNMNQMFFYCTNLQTIYVTRGWSTAAVQESYYFSGMFTCCTSLVGGKGTTYNENYDDGNFAHIDGDGGPGYFTEKPKEAYACYTSTNKTLTFYYDNLRNTREGKTYNLNRVGDLASWINDGNNAYVTKVVFDPLFADARPTSTYGWFYQMENLQTIEGLSYLNTSEVTDMTYMFGYCKNLTSLDLSNFNTSKVTDMKNMFYSCLKLQTIYVGKGWSTAAVTSSSNMFMGCRVLVGGQGTAYDVNHVNKTYARIDGESSNPGYFTAANEAYACYTESNATLTFYYDNQRNSREGTTYDLNTGSTDTEWDTDGTRSIVTKVKFDPSFAVVSPTTTSDWFFGMGKLKTIEGLSYLNTSEVTHMGWMFSGCESLTSIDLSSFNTSNVTVMTTMFFDCGELKTIFVGDGWSTAAVTESDFMFDGCTKLVGGQGTTYNANHVDKTYAHIDGGTSNPGYFTYKKPSGIATDLHQVTSDKSKVQSNEWYTIDGRKLNGMPAKKGVYIHNGRAVVL